MNNTNCSRVFHAVPHEIATCIYDTGINPFMKQPVDVARQLHGRKLPRALMQFFKPENYFAVRQALQEAGRQDLIGSGCDALIPTPPHREALVKRREHANQTFRGEYVPTIQPAAPGKGYRPGRKTAQCRPRRHQKAATSARGTPPAAKPGS